MPPSKGSTSKSRPQSLTRSSPVASSSRLPSELESAFLLKTDTTNDNDNTYKHQYANIYFVRLGVLKPVLVEAAKRKWADIHGSPKLVSRVLDVIKSQLCYIVGTVYMEMPLKPNVMQDIGKELWLTAPPPTEKLTSPTDTILLEDESGRVRLTGARLKQDDVKIVTGVIMAVLGIEGASGDFEVLDLCFAGVAPQVPLSIKEKDDDEIDVDKEVSDEWIAIVSGLDVGSVTPSLSISDTPSRSDDAHSNDVRLQLLVEYLKAELESDEESTTAASALVILGNSLEVAKRDASDMKGSNRYSAQKTFDPAPLRDLSNTFKDLASSVSVHVLPGVTDPAMTHLPQQPMPRAMFGFSPGSTGNGFKAESNPTWLEYGEAGMLATSGQTLDDIFRYVDSNDRLRMARSTLDWRHVAPTAPDTLWCYPFHDHDPFVLSHSPSIYAIGNQPSYATELYTNTAVSAKKGENKETKTRIILCPKFSETGEVVLVNTKTLDIKVIKFSIAKEWER